MSFLKYSINYIHISHESCKNYMKEVYVSLISQLVLRRLSIGYRKHPNDHLFWPNRDQSKIDVFGSEIDNGRFRSLKSCPAKIGRRRTKRRPCLNDAPYNNNNTLNTSTIHMVTERQLIW